MIHEDASPAVIHQLKQWRRPAVCQPDELYAERGIAAISQHIAIAVGIHEKRGTQLPFGVIVKGFAEYGLAVFNQFDRGWKLAVAHPTVVVDEHQTGLNEHDARQGIIRNFVRRQVDFGESRGGNEHKQREKGGKNRVFHGKSASFIPAQGRGRHARADPQRERRRWGRHPCLW